MHCIFAVDNHVGSGGGEFVGTETPELSCTLILIFPQTAVQQADYEFVRLDGTMPQAKRALALERFKSDPEVTVS